VGQYRGLTRHPLAREAGHIAAAVNLSVQGLWTVEGFAKDPKVVAWLLQSRGITPDKRIIVTCNTGQQAAGAWWMLRYLGYPNVIVHDGSWVSWERSPMMKR
jgi:thiosulfate/3-mercaptopyruvate sulfurtransferase